MNALMLLWKDVARDPMDIQSKHTRCSWSVYSECCATRRCVDFPHISVGCSFGNHWRLSSAPSLVQRHYPFLQRGVISKATTLCLFQHFHPWQNQFHSVRLLSGSNAFPALYTMNQRSWVDGIGFPPSVWSRPVLKSKKIHLIPEQIKITHPLTTLSKYGMHAPWCNHLLAVDLTLDTYCRNLVIN